MNLSDKTLRWLTICGFLFLSLVVWIVGSHSVMYRQADGLLDFHNLEQQPDLWTLTGDSDQISFTTEGIELEAEERGNLRAYSVLPIDLESNSDGAIRLIRVSGLIKRLSEPVLISEGKRKPTFVLRPATSSMEMRKGLVIRTNGLSEDYHFSRILRLPVDAAHIELFWQFYSVGAWRLGYLEIDLVEKSDFYRWLSVPLFTSIMILMCILVYSFSSSLTPLRSIGLCLLILLTLSLTLIERSALNGFGYVLFSLYNNMGPPFAFISKGDIQHIGHFAFFFLITFVILGIRSTSAASSGQVLAFVIGLAFLTEALQRHSLTRSSSFGDLTIDVLGIFLAFVMWWIFSLIAGKISILITRENR